MRIHRTHPDMGPTLFRTIPRQTGRLAIVGGRLEADNRRVFDAMRPLCGGRIAVIPVASSIPEEVGAETVDSFEGNGFDARLVPLFWERRESACDQDLVDRLDDCGGVFFTGGDQSRIVNSLGLPRLTGPVKSSGVLMRRTRPSMRSETKQNDRVCEPSP